MKNVPQDASFLRIPGKHSRLSLDARSRKLEDLNDLGQDLSAVGAEYRSVSPSPSICSSWSGISDATEHQVEVPRATSVFPESSGSKVVFQNAPRLG